MEQKKQFLEQIKSLQTLYEQHHSEFVETIEKLKKENVETWSLTSKITSNAEMNIKLQEENVYLKESNFALNEKINKLKSKIKQNQQDFIKKIAQWEKIYQKCTCKITNSAKRVNSSVKIKKDISKIFFASPDVSSVNSKMLVTLEHTLDQPAPICNSTFNANLLVNNTQNSDENSCSDIYNSCFSKTTSPSLISNNSIVTNSIIKNNFLLSYDISKTKSSESKMSSKAMSNSSKYEFNDKLALLKEHTAKSNKENTINIKNSCAEINQCTNFEKLDSVNSKKDYLFKFDDVVRNKKSSEQLKGFTCAECEAFYRSDSLSKNQLKDILKNCSRHKRKFSPPPATQPEFWNIDFPNTQQYIKKGYMLDENCVLPDCAKPKWHTKKLNAISDVTKTE
nr:uncharacterized protein LOC100207460 isoform X1 [Hydra vulgaris]